MELSKAGSAIREIQPGGRLAVLTEDRVKDLYLDRLVQSLEDSGFTVSTFSVPPGEASKSGGVYLQILEFLARIPLTRTDGVVALGGGMVGDLAGFVAATYLRGIKVIQIPTTLLAAVDSSVGGKTAINLLGGKNLAGAFHLPALVIQDASLLETLPEETFRDGMAEVIKYGILEDAALFGELTDPAWVRAHLESVIARCVAIKEGYVAADLYDRGQRQLLNLGHTIAHGIEVLSAYRISHGQAVAMGMARVAEMAVRQGWCQADVPERIRQVLVHYGFSLEIPYDRKTLAHAMVADKKRKGEVLDLVIPEAIGRCRLERIPLVKLEALL